MGVVEQHGGQAAVRRRSLRFGEVGGSRFLSVEIEDQLLERIAAAILRGHELGAHRPVARRQFSHEIVELLAPVGGFGRRLREGGLHLRTQYQGARAGCEQCSSFHGWQFTPLVESRILAPSDKALRGFNGIGSHMVGFIGLVRRDGLPAGSRADHQPARARRRPGHHAQGHRFHGGEGGLSRWLSLELSTGHVPSLGRDGGARNADLAAASGHVQHGSCVPGRVPRHR
jgi:hypothetical protein